MNLRRWHLKDINGNVQTGAKMFYLIDDCFFFVFFFFFNIILMLLSSVYIKKIIQSSVNNEYKFKINKLYFKEKCNNVSNDLKC
jgi:hypothetical protein